MAVMWPDRRLLDLLQVEHPLVLAPMAGFSTVELAASVCAAGGLGSIGCAAFPPELVRETIGRLRALTAGPINVNFFCHVPAQADSRRAEAWRDRLTPYYRDAGLGSPPPAPTIECQGGGMSRHVVRHDSSESALVGRAGRRLYHRPRL